ncbi:MAG: hypothetical protein ABSA21_06885 [Candidatus Limnocylindrales bacterium]|jgi:hypothetical protein
MNGEGSPVVEYDQWRWHIEGKFPSDQPPEQGYVHIGLYLTWLVERDLLDPAWVRKAEAERIVAAIRAREQTGCALRDVAQGSFTDAMLNDEGRAFTTAYYVPEYGYARDYRAIFGRPADDYAVPDGWDSYERLAPLLDRRYDEWLRAGRPELIPMPSLLPRWLGFLRPRSG